MANLVVAESRHPDALLVHALRALNRLSLAMETEVQSGLERTPTGKGASAPNDDAMTGLRVYGEIGRVSPRLHKTNRDVETEEISGSYVPLLAASLRRTPTRSATLKNDYNPGVLQSSPKRPSEDPPENNRVSPKRLSLQFRPERIASTSTPFQARLAGKSPLKGARALDFETPEKKEQFKVLEDDVKDGKASNLDPNGNEISPTSPFTSPDQSIIAHGFPTSFFYSPRKSVSRNAGARPKERSTPSKDRDDRPDSGRRSVGNSGPTTSSVMRKPVRTSLPASWLPTVPLSGAPDPRPSPYYSFYETESGYFTRSRCRDVRDEYETQWASTSFDDPSRRHRHGSTDGSFCCVPDTPSHIFLRRPVSRAKLNIEKETEEATKREEIRDRVDVHCRGMKTERWIGKRMGLDKVDVIGELRAFEPNLVVRVLKLLDDADLKTFSLVSPIWKAAVDEHSSSRKRLLEHEDRQLALAMQNRENLEDKSRRISIGMKNYLEDSIKIVDDEDGTRRVKPRTSLSTPTLGSPSRRALTPRSVNASPHPSNAAAASARPFSPRRRLQTPGTSYPLRAQRSVSSAEALSAATRSLIGLFDSPSSPSVSDHRRNPSETIVRDTPITRSRKSISDFNDNKINVKSVNIPKEEPSSVVPNVNDASSTVVTAKDTTDSVSTPKTNKYLQSPASLLHRKTMGKSHNKSAVKSKQKLRRL